jgi:hypothetical protein
MIRCSECGKIQTIWTSAPYLMEMISNTCKYNVVFHQILLMVSCRYSFLHFYSMSLNLMSRFWLTPYNEWNTEAVLETRGSVAGHQAKYASLDRSM